MAASLTGVVARTTPSPTEFFESWISRAAEDVAVTQVVVVAERAGGWTHRVDWAPHVRLFEVLPRDRGAARRSLAAAGYDPSLPSAWLVEAAVHGVLPQAARLTAFGSVLAADVRGVDDPRDLLRGHGFVVTGGAEGVVHGRRR